MGPNGAGKSSLLSLLYTRSTPDEGSIFFRGDDVTDSSLRDGLREGTAFIGHDPGLFYDLNARENLRLFVELRYRTIPQSLDKRIDEMLMASGLSERTDSVRHFSRGMKQRLGLARLFLTSPAVALMDEPLTGLDRPGVSYLRDLILENKSRGGGAVLSTHSEEPFADITDRFLFINRGRIVADIGRDKFTSEAKKRVGELLYGI